MREGSLRSAGLSPLSLKSRIEEKKPGKTLSFPAFKYAAVILAAGESKRLGFPKQLLKFKGKPLLEIVIDLLNGIGFISKKIVVLGACLMEILRNVSFPPDFLKLYNPYYKRGIGSSVSLAVRCLKEYDAVFFLPVDQPFLRKETLFNLRETFEKGKWSIIAPEGGGLPTLFSMKWKEELMRLDGDEGGRKIIRKYPQEVGRVCVSPEELLDIDRIEDLILLTKGEFQP